MTAKQQWEQFSFMTIPKSAGPTQRRESERIFYSGMYAALAAMITLAGDEPEKAVHSLDRLRAEIDERLWRFVAEDLARDDALRALEAAYVRGHKAIGDSFVRLTNRLHAKRPGWVPYKVEEDAR